MTYTNFYQVNTLSANNYTKMLWNLSQSDSILLHELQKHYQHKHNTTQHNQYSSSGTHSH
jgi:hypothetical protein